MASRIVRPQRAFSLADLWDPEVRIAIGIVVGVCTVAVAAVLLCLNWLEATPNHWKRENMRDGMDQYMADFGLNEEDDVPPTEAKSPAKKRKTKKEQ